MSRATRFTRIAEYPMTVPRLDALFKPRSIAIVGASDDPERISGRPLRYLREAGYAGPLYPVNPTRATVQGLQSYPSVAALPEVPDLAIITVGAKLARASVADCAAAGIPGAVMFTAGFAEIGVNGESEQRGISAICQQSGLRLLGPNCAGLFNAQLKAFGTFASMFDRGFPGGGNVAIVSQSGAYGQHATYMAQQRGLGLGYMITTGNEANLGLGEALYWLVHQPDIEVIMAYAEGMSDAAWLIRAFEVARVLGKRIIFVKVGQSQAGARAAASHTAALAGDDRIYDGIFRQYGVVRARSIEEQIDFAYACSFGKRPRGSRLGIITFSGGFGIHMCDVAENCGLDVTPMPAAAQARLREMLPFGTSENPVDCTGQALSDLSVLGETFKVVLGEGQYDSVIAYFGGVPLARSRIETLPAAVAAGTAGFEDRVVALCMVADPDVVQAYERAGFMVFEDAARAVRAIEALSRAAGHVASDPQRETSHADAGPDDLVSGLVSEHTAKQILARAGIPVLQEYLVQTDDDAARAAQKLGYPVALKIASPDIAHKTEIGGVMLGLQDEQGVRRACASILERARGAMPDARIEGLLVAPMAPKGVETIIGVLHDATFGPMVMLGLGGVFVEVLRDLSFRQAPFDEAEAHRMIGELKGSAVLAGVRGASPADVDTLARTLAAISRYAHAQAGRIESVDINPFVVFEAGKGGVALDALIIPSMPLSSTNPNDAGVVV